MTRQTTAPIRNVSMYASNRGARDVARTMVEQGDLSPAYQRGSVWTEDQRVALVRSWMTGIPVPAVIINDRFTDAWPTDAERMPLGGYVYAVVDGKQRIETAIAWFAGDFAVPASWFEPDVVESTEETEDGPYVRYTGLTLIGQRRFANDAKLPVIEASLGSVEEEAALYLTVNGGGTPQSEADMTAAATVAGRSA